MKPGSPFDTLFLDPHEYAEQRRKSPKSPRLPVHALFYCLYKVGYGLSSMSSKLAGRRWGYILVVLASFTVAGAAHSQTTNSWIVSSGGKWEKTSRWDNGLPSANQSALIISNAHSKVVTINARTAHRFPNSLVISNLIVSAQRGVNNTLFLDRTGTSALHIINGLTIGINPDTPFGAGGSELISANSTLIVDGLPDGQLEDDDTLVIRGGSLITTNCSLQVATDSTAGLLIISHAVVQARDVTITSGGHSSGSIEVVGGTMTLSSSLTVGNGIQDSPGSLLLINGGLLVVTNDETDIGGGSQSSGTMTVSNASFLAADVFLGGERSGGTLAINNGTVTLSGELDLGSGEQSSGSVSLNGGRLVVTNGETHIGLGSPSNASMEISDGYFLARDVQVGGFQSGGALFINGGVSILSSNLQIGLEFSEATVSITSGQLFVTNAALVVDDDAQCNISGGQLAAKIIELGIFDDATLTVDGGSVTVSEGITLGDCANDSAIGHASVDGGQLIVTNAAGTGFIDVRSGQLIVGGGVVQVDKLVMTNSCSSLIHTGGTIVVGSVVLDPNAFGVTSVVPEGNNMRVTWLMGPGQTNALQALSRIVRGHHFTNDFVDIFVVTNNTIPGVVTNYLDIGAATNVPPRMYRARLAP
jgi:hypothetical protein